MDVSGFGIPLVKTPLACLETVPETVSLCDGFVCVDKELGEHRGLDYSFYFLGGGPDVGQENGISVLAGAQGLLGEVDVNLGEGEVEV